MAAGIAITRQDESAIELRQLARASRDVAQARRLLAIALAMEGRSRTGAATAAGMDRQSPRDWVHRFNADGPASLVDKPRSGRRSRLSADQLQAFDAVVEAGPDLETDGFVRWRCADLQRVIADKYGVARSERSVGRILNERSFRHVSVRLQHPKSDAAAQDFFNRFADTVKSLLPAAAAGKALEIWCHTISGRSLPEVVSKPARRLSEAEIRIAKRSSGFRIRACPERSVGDEARVGQKGTLAYVWTRCGTRPRAVQDTRYAWAYLFGAVCPERAVGAGLVMSHANTEAMNLHLAEIGKAVAPDAHAALVLDGAGWHGSDKLIVPDNVALVKLPPYAPELNPIEMYGHICAAQSWPTACSAATMIS